MYENVFDAVGQVASQPNITMRTMGRACCLSHTRLSRARTGSSRSSRYAIIKGDAGGTPFLFSGWVSSSRVTFCQLEIAK